MLRGLAAVVGWRLALTLADGTVLRGELEHVDGYAMTIWPDRGIAVVVVPFGRVRAVRLLG